MKRIRLNSPIQVGTYVQIHQITATQDSVIITLEWGNSSGGMDFNIYGTKDVIFPLGDDVNALLANSKTKEDLDNAVLEMLANGTETAPWATGTFFDPFASTSGVSGYSGTSST
jgi:hypothetical protein